MVVRNNVVKATIKTNRETLVSGHPWTPNDLSNRLKI